MVMADADLFASLLFGASLLQLIEAFLYNIVVVDDIAGDGVESGGGFLNLRSNSFKAFRLPLRFIGLLGRASVRRAVRLQENPAENVTITQLL